MQLLFLHGTSKYDNSSAISVNTRHSVSPAGKDLALSKDRLKDLSRGFTIIQMIIYNKIGKKTLETRNRNRKVEDLISNCLHYSGYHHGHGQERTIIVTSNSLMDIWYKSMINIWEI